MPASELTDTVRCSNLLSFVVASPRGTLNVAGFNPDLTPIGDLGHTLSEGAHREYASGIWSADLGHTAPLSVVILDTPIR